MDELSQSVLDQITTAGGSLEYKDILAATSYENRAKLPRVLKQLRADGLLTQSVELVDGAVVHKYIKVVA